MHYAFSFSVCDAASIREDVGKISHVYRYDFPLNPVKQCQEDGRSLFHIHVSKIGLSSIYVA